MAHNGVQSAEKSLVLRAAVARRDHGNDGGRHFRVFVLELLDDGGHVLADGFGKTGGGNADHLGVVELDEVFKPLEQILGAAKDRAFFRKRRGGDIHRLIVMCCHVPPNVGAAPLRTVQNAHALADAVKGAYRTHGHAHLAGICIQVDKIGAHCLLLMFQAAFGPRRRANCVQADYAVLEMCCSCCQCFTHKAGLRLRCLGK